MKLGKRFGHVTKSGHSVDVAKSAMQKYARRGEAEKMHLALTELDAFNVYDAPAAKAINRIKIVLFEDVSFSEISIVAKVVEEIDEWEKGGRSDKNLLRTICHRVCAAKKARMPSYLRRRFERPNEYDFARFRADLSKPGYLDSFSYVYSNEDEAADELRNIRVAVKYEPLLRFCAAERKRLKRSARHFERLLFVVVLWLWVKHDLLSEFCPDVTPAFTFDTNVDDDYVNVDVRFDDYVYDVHTAIGRNSGKTKEQFRKEGARVENEDVEHVDSNLKLLYENS